MGNCKSVGKDAVIKSKSGNSFFLICRGNKVFPLDEPSETKKSSLLVIGSDSPYMYVTPERPSLLRRLCLTKRQITLAILGLDNAGKTTTTKGLQGEPIENVAPTVGFSNAEFKYGKVDITMYDLGGGKRIRGIWKDYFAEVYGVIYVIDSTEAKRMEECRDVLQEMVEHPKIMGKPVLLLANKQDRDGALHELDICDMLNLEELVNINRCPCRVETCAAVLGNGKKLDKSIKQGFQWLIDTIENSWEKYDMRVKDDVAEQKVEQERDKIARKERVKKIREERERKEKLERRRRGEPEPEDEDEESPPMGDPFKRLDIKNLQKKDEELKAEKRRLKEAQDRMRFKKDYSENDLSRQSNKLPSLRSGRRRLSEGDDGYDDDQRNSSFKNREGVYDEQMRSMDAETLLTQSALKLSLRSNSNNSSLKGRFPQSSFDSSYSERKGRFHGNRGDDDEEDSDEEVITSSRSLEYDRRYHRPSSPTPYTNLRNPGQRSKGMWYDDDVLAPRKPVGHLAPLEPLDVYSSGGSAEPKTRKKKKRFMKNRTAPAPAPADVDEYDSSEQIKQENTRYERQYNPPYIKQHVPTPRDWAVTSQHHSPSRASHRPVLDTVPDSEEDYGHHRWNLADDLPEMPQPRPTKRYTYRSNLDSDDDIVT